MNRKISFRLIAWFFLALFPVTPLYFRIVGFNAANVYCAIFVFIFFLMTLKYFHMPKLKATFLTFSVFLWLMSRILTSMAWGDYTEIIWIILRTVLVGSCLVICVNKKNYFIKAIEVLIIVGGIVAVFGIVEELTHFNVFSLLNTAGETLNYNEYRFGLLRIISFNAQTIVYCIYLMFIASLILYRQQFLNKKASQVVFWIIYVLVVVNALFTISRSTLILFIFCQLLIYFGSSSLFTFVKRLFKLAVIISLLLFILQLFIPKVAEYLQYFLYMILALFDDSYTFKIASVFGNDNLNAVGNRLNLYSWVANSMQGNWLFGNGLNAKFDYVYLKSDGIWTWTQHKTSIEVQWLNTLYRYGVFGLASEILTCIALLSTAVKSKIRPTKWERKVCFNYVCLCSFLSYFIAFFSVNQSSEYAIFYIMIFLMITYNYYGRYSEEE